MLSAHEIVGYVASMLVLLTFIARDMRVLRMMAILSNVAFILYAILDHLPPVLFLHVSLLPVNLFRLRQLHKWDGRPSDQSIIRISDPAAETQGRDVVHCAAANGARQLSAPLDR